MEHDAMTWRSVESPMGVFSVGGTGGFIGAVILPETSEGTLPEIGTDEEVKRGAEQLAQYLAGDRRDFSLSLRSAGTAFQEQVWETLLEIPYGSVESYGSMADRVGRPKGSRAIGQAMGRNPIPIFRPCHRVVASNGIGGYGGGLALKRFLLTLEGIDDL